MPTLRRSEQVLHQLGQRIVHGHLRPGSILPKVEDFGVQEGVSRTVVREALKGLEARGLVSSVQKVGTRVRPRSDWQWWNTEVMTWAMDSPWNREFFRQLTEVRMALEPKAAALAAQNATHEELDEIVRAFRKMEQALGDNQAWAIADYEFHQALAEATHNDLMSSLLRVFQNALIQSRIATIHVLQEEAEAEGVQHGEIVLRYHGAVLEAILQRQPVKAQSAAATLLEAVERLMRRAIPDSQETN
ncbi:MAG: FadR/GntR family transcriptional regulator [Firmicutes bacterium]|nr:FadR/GntR family transcriptional regulator [Bacillota bacterium]